MTQTCSLLLSSRWGDGVKEDPQGRAAGGCHGAPHCEPQEDRSGRCCFQSPDWNSLVSDFLGMGSSIPRKPALCCILPTRFGVRDVGPGALILKCLDPAPRTGFLPETPLPSDTSCQPRVLAAPGHLSSRTSFPASHQSRHPGTVPQCGPCLAHLAHLADEAARRLSSSFSHPLRLLFLFAASWFGEGGSYR